jgi:hypothetical protein
MKHFLPFLCLLFPFWASTQNTDQFPGDLARFWFDRELKLVQATPGFTPPVAARALGYSGLCLYEAVQPGMPGQLSTAGRLVGLSSVPQPDPGLAYHWPTVVNNALALLLDSLFHNAPVAQLDTVHQFRDTWNTVFQAMEPADVFLRSRQHGEAVALAIFAYSATDGGYRAQLSNFPADYVPPVGDGLWVPQAGQMALQPYWGQKRPFLPADTAQGVAPFVHPPFDTATQSNFYDFAFEVYTTGLGLTASQTDIALFYADGGGTITPPGHSIQVLNQVLARENVDLGMAARAYARVGMALADAFVMCWKLKYQYNLLRPITYIRNHIDPTWTPLIGTPPFPEYMSGHSTQSGAFAETMDALFGQQYAFMDSTYLQYGGARQLASFDDWAAEAAVSRLYGGIHYRFANEDGLSCGTAIGQNINDFFAGLLTGTGPVPAVGQLACFPNPTAGPVRLAGDLGAWARIQVYDAAGRPAAVFPAQAQLDLSALPNGWYILRAFDQAGRTAAVARVVKQ